MLRREFEIFTLLENISKQEKTMPTTEVEQHITHKSLTAKIQTNLMCLKLTSNLDCASFNSFVPLISSYLIKSESALNAS